ncbi:MAG: cytochrome ubiquinol oxidase subunit I [Candidatus Calescibacterium sp.]|nr:cytochrome ubiquinol oxidase subunit I [Candidatus Calescibacterium sp.]MCX7971657.1 cytochrome ubiquinol oxidase subunit I [bacterium]MDW8195263.1 cytochrome ubiquinol oxidase subunit I [Candidatus Calescibacterium sp.]
MELLLARIHFAMAATFHFIFPPVTIGLSLLILIFQTLYLLKGKEVYNEISKLLVKILAIIFVVGVITGFTLSFAFGMYWAKFSKIAADLIGITITAEGVFAFFLEGVFLGLLLFGQNRIPKTMYWFSSLMVFLGTHLSAFFILATNSWMQTPAGHEIIRNAAGQIDKIIIVNWFEAIFNPSTIARMLHTTIACWITASLITSAIGAYYLLSRKNIDLGLMIFRVSFIVFALSAFSQFLTGHMQAMVAYKYQPAKVAAFEAIWDTQRGPNIPMSIIAIIDEKNQRNIINIEVPFLNSLLYGIEFFPPHFDLNIEIKGIKEFVKKLEDGTVVKEHPPVAITYYTFRIMIFLGTFFAILALIGLYMLYKNKLDNVKFLKLVLYSWPLPFISNTAGWYTAEIGRQPYIIYGVLKTKDAITPSLNTSNVLLTIIVLLALYLFLTYIAYQLITKIIKEHGNETEKAEILSSEPVKEV